MKFKFYYAKHKITGEFIAFTTSTTGEGDILLQYFYQNGNQINLTYHHVKISND